jgi:3-oxoacyl-[acyl-carrier protein] reductase
MERMQDMSTWYAGIVGSLPPMPTSGTLHSMSQTSIDFTLSDRHAVVCGSTQGIGRAIAEAFAAAGGTITLVGRNEDGLAQVLAGLATPAGQQHRTLCVDFSDWKAVQKAADQHAIAHGPVHVLVNNTGGPAAGFAVDAEPDDFLKAFQMHLACGQALVQAFAPGMREAGYGRVINIISTSVVTPIKGLGVSNTIRGAVANWGRTLAVELGGFGITVNNILPGFTDTARLASLFEGKARRAGTTPADVRSQAVSGIPAARIGEPWEIAAAALFLASPAGGYVNGVNLPVDGGRVVQS